MALFGAHYEFEGEVPTIEQIADALLPLMNKPLVVVKDREEEDAIEAESRSTLLIREDRLRVSLAVSPRARRRGRGNWVSIARRGNALTVYGTHVDPFAAACTAIETLGGVRRPFPPPTDLPQRKARYPVTPGMRRVMLAVWFLVFIVLPMLLAVIAIVLGR